MSSLASTLRQMSHEDEPKLWAEVATRVGPDLLILASQVLGCRQAAEDAVHDTLLYVHENGAQFRGDNDAAAWAWLRRICRTTALQQLRVQAQSRRHAPAVGVEQLAQLKRRNDQDALVELAPVIRDAVAELSDTYRQAICMRFFEEMPYDQMASQLEVSEVSMRKRVQRGLGALRLLLSKRGLSVSVTGLCVTMMAIGRAGAQVVEAGPHHIHHDGDRCLDPSVLKHLKPRAPSWPYAAVSTSAIVGLTLWYSLTSNGEPAVQSEPIAQVIAVVEQAPPVDPVEEVVIADTSATVQAATELLAAPLMSDKGLPVEPAPARTPNREQPPTMRIANDRCEILWYTSEAGKDHGRVVVTSLEEVVYDGPDGRDAMEGQVDAQVIAMLEVYQQMHEKAQVAHSIDELKDQMEQALRHTMGGQVQVRVPSQPNTKEERDDF